ncbi:hypothetical protein [Nocardia asteroides]|uniref:hypothetical protein n=1 Tax=Nocardia asteroides TaxID=1824 RepID=UPI001E648777|nr:hypothetical protein [Nocardia asteroides]UGT60682.1 hypothetical protein LTT61_26505 [Nocardia asteroides]
MRAFVAPQDRVIVVGSCPPAPRGSRRPGPTPGERRVVLGAGLPAPRTIPTGRRRRTVIVPAGFPAAEFEPEAGFEPGPDRDRADGTGREPGDAAAHDETTDVRAQDETADVRDETADARSATEAETGAEYDAADLVREDDEPRPLIARQRRGTQRRPEPEPDEFEIEYRALQIARDRAAEDRTLAGIAELLDA